MTTMPDNLQQRLEWAKAIIYMDAELDHIGTAAHIVLSALEQLERGEFVCRTCGLRKDDGHERGEF